MTKFKVGDKVAVVWTNSYIGNGGYFYTEGMVGRVEFLKEYGRGPVAYIYFEDTGNWPEGAVELYGRVLVGEEDLSLLSKKENWWEIPEGIEWLSTQQDVEDQFLKSQEKEEEKTYRVGQRFLVTYEDKTWNCILTLETYEDKTWNCILTQVEPDVVCLINLESGNRINEPISVVDSQKITEYEMKMIAEYCTFQLL